MPKAPKPAPKPVKPAIPFEKGGYVEIGKMISGAREKGKIIPGTGGQYRSREQHAKILKELLPYNRFQTHLDEGERKKVLGELRAKKGLEDDRTRRILEEEWQLKGKY